MEKKNVLEILNFGWIYIYIYIYIYIERERERRESTIYFKNEQNIYAVKPQGVRKASQTLQVTSR